MSSASCDEIRAAAPELALGVLDGEERARILDHASGCPACRAHLAELAVVAQEVLAAAPVHEPPPGFESRVLGAVRERTPRSGRRRRARRLLAVAAASLVAAVVATWVTLSATRDERDLGAMYGDVLARAGGEYFAVADLRDEQGRRRGLVFGYQGRTPWLTLVLDPAADDRRWRVRISTRDGTTRVLGTIEPATDGRAWARLLPVPVHEVAVVRLDGARGASLNARIPVQGG